MGWNVCHCYCSKIEKGDRFELLYLYHLSCESSLLCLYITYTICKLDTVVSKSAMSERTCNFQIFHFQSHLKTCEGSQIHVVPAQIRQSAQQGFSWLYRLVCIQASEIGQCYRLCISSVMQIMRELGKIIHSDLFNVTAYALWKHSVEKWH